MPILQFLAPLLLTVSFAEPAQELEGGKVPKLWDADALEDWALPVAGLEVAPSFLSSESYYALPIDNLRTYPVYHPDQEPEGYREELLRLGPQPLIKPDKQESREEWVSRSAGLQRVRHLFLADR